MPFIFFPSPLGGLPPLLPFHFFVKNLIIDNGITTIGTQAFRGMNKIKTATIPNSVTSIGERAFHTCTSLTDIIIPNLVTSIKDYAFSSCTSLTNIIIPNSVTSIGLGVFFNCNQLTNVEFLGIIEPSYECSSDGCPFDWCYGLTNSKCPMTSRTIKVPSNYDSAKSTFCRIPVSRQS